MRESIVTTQGTLRQHFFSVQSRLCSSIRYDIDYLIWFTANKKFVLPFSTFNSQVIYFIRVRSNNGANVIRHRPAGLSKLIESARFMQASFIMAKGLVTIRTSRLQQVR